MPVLAAVTAPHLPPPVLPEGVALFIAMSPQLVRKVGMPGSVTALTWHPRLNQIFAGIGEPEHDRAVYPHASRLPYLDHWEGGCR